MMAETNQMPKEGDKCPRCGEGILTLSPSGLHLMCRKCGRMVILTSGLRSGAEEGPDTGD
jgi:ribosomal protein L37E